MVHIDSRLALRSSDRTRDLLAAGDIKTRDPSYTRFVGMMKIILPAVAALVLGLVLIWPQIVGKDERFRVSFSNINTKDVDTLSMVNARYFGTDKDNQPFTVTADAATEASKGAKAVELEAPKADMMTRDNQWLALSADNGLYSQPSSTLDLLGNVNLFHDKGYEIHTQSAQADLKMGTASGDDRVRGQGPFGALTADGFRLYDKGARIIFTGKAHLVLDPKAGMPKK
ncbi:MAG: LPS export ABC transporter periplasmic protein LptC [Alphaproteobacteria bacterium]|nr:LPS export ABC transporter periplasmic protein LptC [Alphaproteobacteria bacterium]